MQELSDLRQDAEIWLKNSPVQIVVIIFVRKIATGQNQNVGMSFI